MSSTAQCLFGFFLTNLKMIQNYSDAGFTDLFFKKEQHNKTDFVSYMLLQ